MPHSLPAAPTNVDELIREAEQLEPGEQLRVVTALLDSLEVSKPEGLSATQLMALRRLLYGRDHTPAQVYSVPRRFDLATIFVIMLVFSMLFGAMKAFDFPPAASAIIAGFIFVVGAGQAFFFRGMQPRAASMVGGALAYAIGALVLWLFDGRRFYSASEFVIWISVSIVGGAVLGYLSGVLIGGVFLIADKLRNLFSRRRPAAQRSRELAD